MNDLHHPCELRAERISLAAAGCLSPDEQREVRRHIETCSGCRERFRHLAELCGALAQARLPADDTAAAIVARVMSAVAADQSQRRVVGVRAEMIHPTVLSRSLNGWRWIMRSPVSRVAATVVFVLAIAGVALLFHGGGATYAFADFIAPILEAKTAKFKVTTEMEMKGRALTTTAEVMMLDAARSRQETEMPDRSKMIMIFDWGQGKSLTLTPAVKQAVVLTFVNMPKDKIPKEKDPLGYLRSLLLDARDKPDVKREPLGEKDIDGRRVVGYRIASRGMVVSLWGDPKTGEPVRAEMTMAMFGGAKTTMSDFAFNVPMDESLFSTDPPAGYTVQRMKIDTSPAEEADLIETFREYSKLSGGAFPDSLDMQTMIQIAMKKFMPGKAEKPNRQEMQKMSEAEKQKLMQKLMKVPMQKMAEAQIKLQRGLTFALMLPTDADAHYAGKSVKLGAADKPIFWYRPKDAKKYRVIYADLSVRDADAPPRVPNAQPVPNNANPRK